MKSIFFRNNPLPMWIYNLETYQFLDINHAAVHHYGYSVDEFKSMTIKDIRPPEDVDRLVRNVENVTEGIDEAGTWRHRKKDGEIIYVEITSHSMQSNGQRAELVVAHDVTERVKNIQALRESEAALKQAQRVAHVGSWVWHIPENRLEWSDEMYRIFGIDKDTFTGMLTDVIANAIHPDDRQAVEQSNLAVIQEKKPSQLEYRVVWPDGTVRTVCGDAGELFLDETGKAFKLTGIVQDITERKQVEEALRESEERYRDIFNGVQDAIFVESLDGRILAVNDRACEMFGYSHEEFLTKTVYDLVPVGQQILMLNEDEISSSPMETINLRANGETFPIEISGRVQIINGERVLLIIVRDITDRKRAEEEILRRIRELETINRVSIALRASLEQDQMLAILLEEILTTLGSQNGAISLIDQETGELHQVIARGWPAALAALPIQPDKALLGKVFEIDSPSLFKDFSNDLRIPPDMQEQIPSGWGGVCIPIHAMDQILGILLLAFHSEHELRTEHIRLLETLMEMAGRALHRMRLHEETKRRLEQLKSLRTIDLAIVGNLDHKDTLATLLDEVISQLGVSAADVLLLDHQGQTLQFAAGQGFRTQLNEIANVEVGESFAGKAVLADCLIRVENNEIASQNPLFFKFWKQEGFSSYYAVPLIVKGQAKGVLEVFHRDLFTPYQEWLNFLETLAGQAAIAIDNADMFGKLERANAELIQAYEATIEGWSQVMDLRDKETEGHSKRVTEVTLSLARAMSVDEQELIHIRRGALLHDIGKMTIPDHILLKAGKLTDAEWISMQQHPQTAYDMLKNISYLNPALEIPYCHHEKWDGTGYPRSLKGEEIPLAARIFAVVDVWDALTNDRPYRKAWTRKKALQYIREQAGAHFDPHVVDAFLEISGKLTDI